MQGFYFYPYLRFLLMRYILILVILLLAFTSQAQVKTKVIVLRKSPKDSALVMQKTKTTTTCDYMSEEEKSALQWLNIARLYPKWFIYFHKLKDEGNHYQRSLYRTLNTMKPIAKKLEPSRIHWASAHCHAETSGANGYVGHDRQAKKCWSVYKLDAECCHYGKVSPDKLILELLLDEGVKDYGHRQICLYPKYVKVGISFMKHTKAEQVNVFDFGKKKWVPRPLDGK